MDQPLSDEDVLAVMEWALQDTEAAKLAQELGWPPAAS